jgi:excisionase family DNA binding protein
MNKRIPKAFCTTREAADLLGISVRTAQLWCEHGLLNAWKTAGGHRRIMRESIERLLRIADTVVPEGAGWRLPAESVFSATNAGGLKAAIGTAFRVLVVEDDEGLSRLYAFRLRRWAIRPLVETASSGYEALAKLACCTPDMLIMDLNLPGPNGFHLLRVIHEVAEPKIPLIVAISGLGREEVERQGGIPSGVPLLQKPVSFQALAALAQEALARRDATVRSDSPEFTKVGEACELLQHGLRAIPQPVECGMASMSSEKNSA